jgi:hypothetical protein
MRRSRNDQAPHRCATDKKRPLAFQKSECVPFSLDSFAKHSRYRIALFQEARLGWVWARTSNILNISPTADPPHHRFSRSVSADPNPSRYVQEPHTTASDQPREDAESAPQEIGRRRRVPEAGRRPFQDKASRRASLQKALGGQEGEWAKMPVGASRLRIHHSQICQKFALRAMR